MRLFLLTATAGMTFFFSLACGGQEMDNEVKVTEFEALLEAEDAASGGAGDAETGNVGACKAYVEAFNSLECMATVQLEAAEMCPDALNMAPTDMAPYYTCLRENAKCNGGLPDLAGQSNCSM